MKIEEMQFEQKLRMQTAAFIGWQTYLVQPSFAKKPPKKKSFKQWLQMLGLAEKGHDSQQLSEEEAIALAELNDARARQAFRRRPLKA